MKSKKNLYYLIPAVVLVWGLIIYRLVDFTSDQGLEATSLKRLERTGKEIKTAKLYRPRYNYRDPFLKNLTVAEREIEVEEELIESVIPEKPMPDFDIQYQGYITPTSKYDRVALLRIEGREVFVRKGETILSFQLLRIFEDSVILKNEEFEFVIRKTDLSL